MSNIFDDCERLAKAMDKTNSVSIVELRPDRWSARWYHCYTFPKQDVYGATRDEALRLLFKDIAYVAREIASIEQERARQSARMAARIQRTLDEIEDRL